MSKPPVIYYAVTLERGNNRDKSHSMLEQEHWDEHASFMDALVDADFAILGGPLDDAETAPLIIHAANRQATLARFAADPWIALGLRRIAKVERRHILLDARR